MTAISVTVKDKTPELMQKVEAALGRFVRKGTAYIEGELKTSMAEPKSGRRYKRGKDKVHIASAPGESPAVDSSDMTNSFEMLFPSMLEGKVGTPAEYALLLEEGTDRMDPRPLWEKTAQESLPTLENLLRAELQTAQ